MFYILEQMFVLCKKHSVLFSHILFLHMEGHEQASNRSWLSMRSHLLQKGYHGDAARKVRGGGMTEEHLTADLLKQLSAAARPEDYLLQGETIDRELSDYLNELRNDRGMKRAAVVRESAVNETFVYDIFKGKSLPGRNNALKLAFALRCSLIETQRILRLAGVSELWPKRSRDAVIIWCIERGLTLAQCDDELYRLGEQTLVNPEDDSA